MKNIRVLFAIIVLSVCAAAQQSAASPGVSSRSAGDPATTTPRPTEGKVAVPPEKAKPISIPKATAVPVIDGKPDEEAWASAALFKDFYQTGPGYNTAPSKPTEVRMMYDEHFLYVAFKCWDEKDKIRATVAKRDNVFGEDNVRMWLDTYDDRRRAYVLGFNPLGIQQDGIFTEGQGADFSVDIVMESKGVIEDWGWSVEVKIPFKSLRYASGKGKFWGFNTARNIDRFNDEFDQWLPDDRDVSGFLIKHGKITGLDDVKYERTLEIVPSVTVGQTAKRLQVFPTGGPISDRFTNEKFRADLGVTLKYSLSPNVTLDAAINPDFAEIEADAPVVTANQRFPIFFQEKRPFFLEGQDTFSSPMQVFYSRQIFDPDVAVKLTGKVGKTTFGILAASDNRPGDYSDDERNNPNLQPRIAEFLDKNASFAIVRVKRDFGKENMIGFFGTFRSFPEQKNLLGGVDGRYKWNSKTVSVFQVAVTNSKRCFFDAAFEPLVNPTQAQTNRDICGTGSTNQTNSNGATYNQYRTGNGIGYYFNLDYTTETHGWFFEVGGKSKDYRADSGFTRQTNTNNAFFVNRISTKSKPKAFLIQTSWNQNASINFDWQGRIQNQNLGTNVNLTLQHTTFINVEFGNSYEKIYEEEFGLKRAPTRPQGTFQGDPTRSTWQQYGSFNINQVPSKRFNYGAFAGFIRNSFDYFFFDSTTGLQNPGPGLQLDAQIFMELKPIDPLRVSASYTKSRLNRNDNRVRSFDSDLLTLRSTYQFTRFIFARFRLDFDGTSKNYSGQALFGWNPNPGTAFYVGYNDDFNYNGFNPYTGQLEPGFQRNGRTFFVRASYLFRKSF